MRYYIYRDIELLKEIYSQLKNLKLDLDVIERIDAKTCFEEEGMFVEPETKTGNKNQARIKIGMKNNNSSNVTTINECANISDVKDIYIKRFYHNLIENIEKDKIKCPGICKVKGSINCIRNEEDRIDRFIEIDGTYVWFECDKILNDMKVLSSITNKIQAIGCVIKEEDNNSPRVIKAIAMYIDA